MVIVPLTCPDSAALLGSRFRDFIPADKTAGSDVTGRVCTRWNERIQGGESLVMAIHRYKPEQIVTLLYRSK